MVFYDDRMLVKLKRRLEKTVFFLIVTATDIETDALFDVLEPIQFEAEIIKAAPDRNTYHIGRIGVYPIVHVKCSDQGMMDRDSSIMTVNAALSYWKPSGIIMVGIAFGKNSEKQKIGDVLVATSLRNYEDVKVMQTGLEDRSSNPKTGIVLLNRFKNMYGWKHEVWDGVARIHFGEVLSGEKLVDNKDFRDKLFQRYPMAIGGEMEGYGVYTAAENHDISEWIIVKAICDFAENKQERKIDKQKLAAESAFSCVKQVLSEPVFEGLKKKNLSH